MVLDRAKGVERRVDRDIIPAAEGERYGDEPAPPRFVEVLVESMDRARSSRTGAHAPMPSTYLWGCLAVSLAAAALVSWQVRIRDDRDDLAA